MQSRVFLYCRSPLGPIICFIIRVFTTSTGLVTAAEMKPAIIDALERREGENGMLMMMMMMMMMMIVCVDHTNDRQVLSVSFTFK
jgi:hypothetical protein